MTLGNLDLYGYHDLTASGNIPKSHDTEQHFRAVDSHLLHSLARSEPPEGRGGPRQEAWLLDHEQKLPQRVTRPGAGDRGRRCYGHRGKG